MRSAKILFLLLWHCSLYGQLNGKYTFRHIDQTDGLLHTTVRGIGQDKRGFIWILTTNGLQRFDGYRFLNYPDITNQYSFEMIHDSELYIDTLNNTIWIYKVREMQKLDLATNSFTTISLQSYIEDNPLFPIEKFKERDQKDWQISEAGIVRNFGPDTYYNFNNNPGQSFRENLVVKDPVTGNFWSQGFDRITLAQHQTGRILTSADPQPEESLLRQVKNKYGTNMLFRFLLLDRENNLWISTWKEDLLRYNLDTHMLTTYSLKEIKNREEGEDQGTQNVLVQTMYEDRQKNLWIGTDYAGLLRYDRTHDNFEFITSDEKIKNGLQYNFDIYTIFQDRDDNIWVGTDRGINVFNPYHPYFQVIRHMDGQDASMPRHDINDVIETSQGEIMVATWGGGITFYDHAWNFLRNVKLTGPDAYNQTWCFVEKEDGLIWAGTQEGYIHQYDPVHHTFKTLHPPETENSTISTMSKDKDGNILIGLFNGNIVMWNKAEDRFYKSDMPHSLNVSAIKNLFVDHANTVWGASVTGLVEYHVDTRMVMNVYLPDSTDSHIGVSIEGIEQYNDSMLLVGTIYRGLYLFNVNTKKFSRLPGFDLPVNSSVFAIKKDEDGFWFTTNFNLYQWREATHQVIIFNLEPSMVNASFSAVRFNQLKDGRWITSTIAEVICFDPQGMAKDKSDLFDVEISRMNILEKPVYIDSFLQHHKAVVLPYDKNFFSIEYSALDFTGVRQTNFSYRLIGVDKSWIQSTTQQLANYTDLKPGNYTFEVKASDGIKTSGITSLPIIINPPWWGTFGFRISVFLVIAAAIYWTLKKRIEQIRQQSELRHRVADMEMKALRAQMNPHFIFNCLSSIDNLIQTDQKTKATDYLAKFALLIRAILENSKANSIPCWKDLEALKLYLELESLRWENQIICEMNIEPQILEGDYKVPPLVIQPFVENAIHHGLLNKLNGVKKLDIDVRMENQFIKYTITDNGVGRVQAAAYKKLNKLSQASYGTQMTNERISLFNRESNGSIKITDLYDGESKPSGTKVEVWLTTQPNIG